MTTDTSPERSVGRAAPRDEGFSLLEVIITMAILLVASTALFGAFGSSTKQVTSVQGMVEEQAKARVVLSGLTSEFRNAFTGDTTVLNRVAAISATGVTFYTADRSTPVKLKKISYQLTTGTLTRSSTISTNAGPPYDVWTFPAVGNALPVLKGVTNTTLFVFRDKAGSPLAYTAASLPLVASMEVTLSVRDKGASSTQKAETYTTTIKLRGTG